MSVGGIFKYYHDENYEKLEQSYVAPTYVVNDTGEAWWAIPRQFKNYKIWDEEDVRESIKLAPKELSQWNDK